MIINKTQSSVNKKENKEKFAKRVYVTCCTSVQPEPTSNMFTCSILLESISAMKHNDLYFISELILKLSMSSSGRSRILERETPGMQR